MGKDIATREAYGKALVEFGVDDRIVVLDADLSKSTRTDLFKKEYPDRFFDIGIAEANMMTYAAGLATCGKIVFASTFAIFAAGRAYEQIRNSIAYPDLNVKIGASHAGISVGEDGASHQAIEDIALMTAIPNMTVISPCDEIETRFAVKAAIDYEGPVYLRLGRLGVPKIMDEVRYTFELGKGVTVMDGDMVTIISTGLMTSQAVLAARELANQNISARVINIHTLKPIDEDIIIKAARDTGAIVTAEEHSVIGGLGSIVARVTAQNFPVPVKMVGVEDRFGKSGKPQELLQMYGLTKEDIMDKVRQVLKLKGELNGR